MRLIVTSVMGVCSTGVGIWMVGFVGETEFMFFGQPLHSQNIGAVAILSGVVVLGTNMKKRVC